MARESGGQKLQQHESATGLMLGQKPGADIYVMYREARIRPSKGSLAVAGVLDVGTSYSCKISL